jgi:hypothetical protein
MRSFPAFPPPGFHTPAPRMRRAERCTAVKSKQETLCWVRKKLFFVWTTETRAAGEDADTNAFAANGWVAELPRYRGNSIKKPRVG